MAGFILSSLTSIIMADNISTQSYGNYLSEMRAKDALVARAFERLKEEEAFSPTAYRFGEKTGNPEKYYTIGYGHYGSDVKPTDSITQREAEELLLKDINVRIPTLIGTAAFPDFLYYPAYLQDAIFSEHFRGSIMQSPKTRKLIRQKKYRQAAKEFLNNEEYTTAKEKKKAGIRPRMERVSEALIRYAEELGQ